MNNGCLKCSGTGFLAGGTIPCPVCNSRHDEVLPTYEDVPIQYQGLVFDKDLLPHGMQDFYGKFMEELKQEILNNVSVFQRNTLICCRPNCGKSVWAYNIYSHLKSRGVTIPPIKDILEVRDIFNLVQNDTTLLKEYSNSRLAIIKLPRHVTADMFDLMFTIIERRVRNNGCTIFLYGGTKDDLKKQDYFGKLKYLTGNGSFNSIKIESFYDKTNKENEYDS